jgi:hypothetical protein
MVAIAIVTFGLAAIYSQFQETKRPSQRRLQVAQAQFHAQQVLSEALACSYADLKAWKPASTFVPVTPESPFESRTTVDQIAGSAVEVVVQVGWNQAGEEPGQNFPEGQLVTVKGFRAQ